MIGAKHKAISEYYRTLDELQTQQDVTHEGGLRRAFSEFVVQHGEEIQLGSSRENRLIA